MRTDENNNPTAFTTNVARLAGLQWKTEYLPGTPFPPPSNLITARLIGDPVALTIAVIDAVGFRTWAGARRWLYIDFPHFVWLGLAPEQKRDIIGWMYQQEGGVTMRGLFPHYGEA